MPGWKWPTLEPPGHYAPTSRGLHRRTPYKIGGFVSEEHRLNMVTRAFDQAARDEWQFRDGPGRVVEFNRRRRVGRVDPENIVLADEQIGLPKGIFGLGSRSFERSQQGRGPVAEKNRLSRSTPVRKARKKQSKGPRERSGIAVRPW